MAKLIKLETTKTYATYANAVKAFEKKYSQVNELRYFIATDENGRFFPVCLLNAGDFNAVQRGVHFHFNVVG